MNAYCLCLALSNDSEVFLSKQIKNRRIKTATDYECCYHTSILQFYSHLDYYQLIHKLCEYFNCFKIDTSLLSDWDKNSKEVGSISVKPYSPLFASIELSYRNYDYINYIAKEILQNSGLKNLIFKHTTCFPDEEKLSARFDFVCSFPKRVLNLQTKPHTTLGFIPANRFEDGLVFLSSFLDTDKILKQHIIHSKLIFSRLNHLCMTPRNSFTLAYL